MNAAAPDCPVYAIGIAKAATLSGSLEEMGSKAWNLQRMAVAGLPVPQAFVLATDWCRLHHGDPAGTRARLREALAEWTRRLEQACGLAFGGERKPLLLSVRSGAPVSMPGMMDTVLNIGLCDRVVRGLVRLTGNPRLAWDSYRRLVQQYAQVVHGVDGTAFEEMTAAAVARAGVPGVRELDFESLEQLAAESLELFADVARSPFPQDPREQLEAAAVAVLESWRSARAIEYRRLHGIGETMGTAVTVQRMVFGNAGGTSGSGVGFTRDPATGENRLYLDFLFNAQGEDVVSGRHAVTDTERLPLALPEVGQRLEELRRSLEATFGDAQEFEFTVQDGRLYLLQSRTAKRTPWAALRIAVEQVRGPRGHRAPARGRGGRARAGRRGPGEHRPRGGRHRARHRRVRAAGGARRERDPRAPRHQHRGHRRHRRLRGRAHRAGRAHLARRGGGAPHGQGVPGGLRGAAHRRAGAHGELRRRDAARGRDDLPGRRERARARRRARGRGRAPRGAALRSGEVARGAGRRLRQRGTGGAVQQCARAGRRAILRASPAPTGAVTTIPGGDRT